MALNKPTVALVSGQVLTASFTTDIAWNPYQAGGFHVIWTGVTGSTATVKLTAFNIGGSSQPANLTSAPSAFTLLTEGGTAAYLFNVDPIHADFIRFNYIAGNNTLGSMSVFVRRDGYGA